MKINRVGFEGKTPFKQSTNIELDTLNGKLPLTLTPLPLDFPNRLEEKIPSPNPPKKGYIRDRKGKFVREALTGQPIMEFDKQDPKYKKEMQVCQDRQTTMMVLEALKEEESIEIESKRESFKNPLEFYDSVREEFQIAGLSIGQQLQIVEAVNKVSGLKEDELEDEKKS